MNQSDLHWYYLHENGSLIHKTYYGEDQRRDFSESTFVKMYWIINVTDRETIWNFLLEALYYGASPERVKDLSVLWGCDAEDLVIYMTRVKPNNDRRKGLHMFLSEILKVNAGDWLEWLANTPSSSSPDFSVMPREAKDKV